MTPKQNSQLQKIMTDAHTEYASGLTTRVFFKINDKSIGKDLVQETFMKTWKYLVKGGKIEIMKSFLYHVLNCLIVDEYRKNKVASLDFLVEKGFEPGINEVEKNFNIFDGKIALMLIARLPVTYQKVMRMKYVQDLTIQEISLITGKTKNTVTVQLHRGLEKLKLLYGSS
jgi:RNA polymerase sigma-70 factor, ECF subfamily